jgi:hypothetical protein
MTQISNAAEFQSLVANDEFSRLLAVNSEKEFAERGFGWRTGQLEHAEHPDGVRLAGVVLFRTPQRDDELKDESTHVQVVKLYGTHELPFRVIGMCTYENVFEQSSESVLKAFPTLEGAAGYAIAAHQAHSFDPEFIQGLLAAPESATEGHKLAAQPSRRSVKPESDEFSP